MWQFAVEVAGKAKCNICHLLLFSLTGIHKISPTKSQEAKELKEAIELMVKAKKAKEEKESLGRWLSGLR